MKSPAQVLCKLLVDLGVAEAAETPALPKKEWIAYVAHMPDGGNTHDNAIAVYNTSGFPDGRLMGDGKRIEHPGFQIRVRASSDSISYGRAQSIALALDGVVRQNVTVDGEVWRVDNISRTGTLLGLGQDEKRRTTYTFNGVITLTFLED